jgi:hypothetical protein
MLRCARGLSPALQVGVNADRRPVAVLPGRGCSLELRIIERPAAVMQIDTRTPRPNVGRGKSFRGSRIRLSHFGGSGAPAH